MPTTKKNIRKATSLCQRANSLQADIGLFALELSSRKLKIAEGHAAMAHQKLESVYAELKQLLIYLQS